MKPRTSTSRSLAVVALLTSSALASACNGSDGNIGQDQSDVTSKTTYVDLGDFVSTDADIERWIEIRQGLTHDFDQICGDTFCGGDFSNIYSLGFTCSVSSIQGRIRECVWTFAASDELIDGASGNIASTIPFYECRVRPTGTVRNFLPAFQSNDYLHSELPGLDGSLYDQLGDCFDAPLDGDPLPEPTDGNYTDAASNLEGDEIDAWYTMTAALRESFDQACGDSFCEGEYTNLQPLRFRCSLDTDSGLLGTCAWMFAGSNVERNAKGFNVIDSESYVCTFPVDATPAALTAALDPEADGEDLLHRPLPGSTVTLNDVLIDCL
ncbi:MAG: hypothetical protein HOW73_28115 [Polyangiaceae bacterium]|nr:hypothetical protein [Polyangiaceae bacterium]